jgi:signal transduction histidine kinase
LQDKYEKQLLENKIKEQNIKLLNTEIKLKKAELSKKTEKIKTQRIIMLLLTIGTLLILLVLILIFRTRQNKQKIKFQKNQLKAIIDAQEEERTRFARDVHDGIGQYFFALKLNISQLETINLNEKLKIEIYDKTIKIIDDLQQEIRNISFSIMPSILYYKGLIPALEELIDKINKLGKIKIDIDTFEFHERLNSQMEVAIYRITQELTNNILQFFSIT